MSYSIGALAMTDAKSAANVEVGELKLIESIMSYVTFALLIVDDADGVSNALIFNDKLAALQRNASLVSPAFIP